MKNILNNNWFQFLLFTGVVWLVFVHLHINRHLEDIIIGPHFWRKSDTYAQIMNYYYNGLNFFDHGIYFNQLDSNGKALGEFPLIYWIIAAQLKWFGYSVLLIKVNWLIILLVGLFSVYKISVYFLKHIFYALIVALLLFLSPVFTFYSIDYLPDPLALNITFFGLWFLLKNYISPSRFNLAVGIGLISIGGMIKPFFLIPFIALICVLLVKRVVFKEKQNILVWQYGIPFAFVGLWFVYSGWYNSTSGSDYFLSSTRPIWSYGNERILAIFNKVTTFWSEHYFHDSLYYIFFSLMVLNLISWKKVWVNINLFYLFCVLGVLAFISLFYEMFFDHDYYVYPILFILPLTVGITLFKLNFFLKSKVSQSVLAVVLLVLLFLGLNNSWEKNQGYRKKGWINNRYIFEKYQRLEPFLLRSNVQQNDLIVTASDMSPCFALSLLNRKGWSGYQIKRKFTIDKMIKEGAKFMVINDQVKLPFKDSSQVSLYLDYPIADTNHVFIYDLQPYKLNKKWQK